MLTNWHSNYKRSKGSYKLIEVLYLGSDSQTDSFETADYWDGWLFRKANAKDLPHLLRYRLEVNVRETTLFYQMVKLAVQAITQKNTHVLSLLSR